MPAGRLQLLYSCVPLFTKIRSIAKNLHLWNTSHTKVYESVIGWATRQVHTSLRGIWTFTKLTLLERWSQGWSPRSAALICQGSVQFLCSTTTGEMKHYTVLMKTNRLSRGMPDPSERGEALSKGTLLYYLPVIPQYNILKPDGCC